MNKTIIAVLAVVVVAIALVVVWRLGALRIPTAAVTTTTTSSISQGFPGMLTPTQVSDIMGGNWKGLTNASFIAFISGNTINFNFVNGTKKSMPLTSQNASNFEFAGPSGQPNGGYPMWFAAYSYYQPNPTANMTYALLLEAFRAANSSQVNWTIGAVESRFSSAASTSQMNGVFMVALRPYAPLSNITYVFASYRSSYLIIVISDAPVSIQTLENLTVEFATGLP